MKQKYAVLFPGQGVQYPGMGETYYKKYNKVRNLYKQASEILGKNMEKICFESGDELLKETRNAQPAILLTSYAAYISLIEEIEYKPQIMMGHSLGEISALLASEVLSFEDALKLIQVRANAMYEATQLNKGAMCAVMTKDIRMIELACEESRKSGNYVVPANYNEKSQTVISGTEDAILNMMQYFQEKNIASVQLNVQGAFHSDLMQFAYEPVLQQARKLTFHQGSVDVISNVGGNFYSEISDYPVNLSKQIVSPVWWEQGMEKIKNLGISNVVDIGPGNTIANIARRQTGFSSILSETENHQELIQFFTQSNNLSFIKKCLAVAVCTPNKNKNSQEYQEHVVSPYQKLVEFRKIIAEENRSLTSDEKEHLIKWTDEVLTYKKVSKEEKNEKMKEILMMR